MNKKTIFSYFTNELSPLQKEQLLFAKQDSINDKYIGILSSGEYNFKQMEQIRLALKHKIDSSKMKYLLDSSLSHETMEDIRMKLENNEVLDISISHKRVIHTFIVVSVLLMIALFVPVYSKPRLLLKEDSITLQQDESFDAMKYIQIYTGKGRLIIPSVVDTNKKGNQVVVYRLITDEKTIEKILLIHVV